MNYELISDLVSYEPKPNSDLVNYELISYLGDYEPKLGNHEHCESCELQIDCKEIESSPQIKFSNISNLYYSI